MAKNLGQLDWSGNYYGLNTSKKLESNILWKALWNFKTQGKMFSQG